MAEESKPRLGRGLAALIGDSVAIPGGTRDGREQRRVPIEFVKANPKNPRRSFDPEQLEELAQSLREKGLIQPIVVRPQPSVPNSFEIVAGERRWRAAQLAGLHDVPVIVIEASDKEALEIAIVENVQRADLNPLEEAVGYEQLLQNHNYTQNDLAKIIGKSRSYVANALRLLSHSDVVKTMLSEGKLTAGHARALLSVGDPDSVARQIVHDGLSVRDVERLGQTPATVGEIPRNSDKKKAVEKTSADTIALEQAISEALGMKVSIIAKGEMGSIKVSFTSIDQLDAIAQKLRS